jgi:hypothetical protein
MAKPQTPRKKPTADDTPLEKVQSAALTLARRRKRQQRLGTAGYYKNLAEQVEHALKDLKFKSIGEVTTDDYETYKRLIDVQAVEFRERHRTHKAKQRSMSPEVWERLQLEKKLDALNGVFAVGKASPSKQRAHRRLIRTLWNYLKRKSPDRFKRIEKAFKAGDYDYNYHVGQGGDVREALRLDSLDNYLFTEMQGLDFARKALKHFAKCSPDVVLGFRISHRDGHTTVTTFCKQGEASPKVLAAVNKLLVRYISG